MYDERRLSFLTMASVSAAVFLLMILPTLLAPFASAGQLPLSPTGMDPAVFVYTAPEVCGFIPYDIAADIDEPIDADFVPGPPGLNGEPSVFAPDLKEGDYATNFFLHNSDQQLPVERLRWFFFLEYFGYTGPDGVFTGFTVKRAINMTQYLDDLHSASIVLPRNGTIAIGCNQVNAWDTSGIDDPPTDGTNPDPFNKTQMLIQFLDDANLLDPADVPPGSVLFWKGFNIWNQTKGDGFDTTLQPIDIDVVYSYESSSNKIWFQILKDPSRTMPRNLIGKNLEIVAAFRPLNKTQLGNNWFEVVQIDTLIRNAIRDQFPAAADRVILRVIDVDYGVGSSWQVVESLTFREVPP
uniref:Uncharacterized protein n=1 Tax=Caldiarchaeum subterraneum TaxID=311458 RepID=E6NAI0_CALS0|nr:hypothetical protein HGMM_F01D06C03 [Candidatus Caldarchaeum subterraneum]